MARETYRGGDLQFTFKVDSKDKTTMTQKHLSKMNSVFMELDLNPNSKIYDDDEVVFDTEAVTAALQFMINFIKHLEKDETKKLQRKKYGILETKSTQRIAKIVLNKNSPDTSNLYTLSSYNGDLRPPDGTL